MLNRCFLLVCMLALVSCSEPSLENKSLTGFWVSVNGRMIAEFTDSYAVFKPFTEKQKTVSFDEISDNKYKIQGLKIDNDSDSVLVVDWSKQSFSLTNVYSFDEVLFTRAPNVKIDDILGTWHSHSKDEKSGTEISEIITQKVFSYDYDFLELNHSEKTYSTVLDLGVKSTFSKGFIFSDTEEDPPFSYYITSFQKDKMEFINVDGYQWSQTRNDKAEHIAIPEGYSKK